MLFLRQFRRTNRRNAMSLTELCILLGAMFAFATLILKVVETARSR
jgi:hypothetical protein